ncbi:hypothetical protein LZ31DRAFT_35716 [Colletotrichum somersetense]|nr:hypothetical protein LZ31DRAFT_35716 [Colletotrichum somersetense]
METRVLARMCVCVCVCGNALIGNGGNVFFRLGSLPPYICDAPCVPLGTILGIGQLEIAGRGTTSFGTVSDFTGRTVTRPTAWSVCRGTPWQRLQLFRRQEPGRAAVDRRAPQ